MDDIKDFFQNEYLRFLFITGVSIIGTWVFYFIINSYVRKWAEKTETDLDDLILNVTLRPTCLLVFMVGFFIAIRSLSLPERTIWLLGRGYYVFIVFILAFITSKILTILISRWLKTEKGFEKSPQLITKIVAVTVYLIAFLMMLKHFEIEISPLIATLGVGGLAVGLALQGTLSNFFAGLQIISDHPFYVGDFIELAGTEINGYVEDIGWRTTRIRTTSNTIVIIPNSKVSDSILINNNFPIPEMSVVVPCGVSYSSDLDKVERVTIDVAKEIQKNVQGAVKDFEPFIRYNRFGDSNIQFSIILKVQTVVDKYLLTHHLIKMLKVRYEKEGIEIYYPTIKVFK